MGAKQSTIRTYLRLRNSVCNIHSTIWKKWHKAFPNLKFGILTITGSVNQSTPPLPDAIISYKMHIFTCQTSGPTYNVLYNT